jgi:hypothetical protein
LGLLLLLLLVFGVGGGGGRRGHGWTCDVWVLMILI